MAVRIGSARIDENGHISGGKAGDQTGNEVSTQNYYVHSKGWRVLRCKLEGARYYIAQAMERACANNKIGYDQNERNDLYIQVKDRDFDPGQATTATETDCSALVRVCALYGLRKAGSYISISDFNTATEAGRLLGTGMFYELTGTEYTKTSNKLCRGDILVTKTKGHTVIVLDDGPQADHTPEGEDYELGDRILYNGCEGSDVKQLQALLIQCGYSCGSWGADGDFGDATEQAVRRFQTDHSLDVDGEAGPITIAALIAETGGDADAGKHVRIIGGNCYVRAEPNTTGKILGVVNEGTVLPYAGQTSETGWMYVEYIACCGWVSGKYARLEEYV